MKGIWFFSYAQFRTLRPNQCDLVISVSDRFYRADVASGFFDIVRLSFSDVDLHKTDLASLPPAAVPFNDSHADAIQSGIERFLAAPTPRYLLVHCYAGVSRSAAIAWWTSRYYDIPILTTFPPHGLNRYVLSGLPGTISPPEPATQQIDERIKIGRHFNEGYFHIGEFNENGNSDHSRLL